MNPKFTLKQRREAVTGKNSQDGAEAILHFGPHYDLSVRFHYHEFPITYDFHLEPVPSPQEFIRDHVIKPLMFATLRMSELLEGSTHQIYSSQPSSSPEPLAWHLSKENIEASLNNPFQTIKGIGSKILESYYTMKLDKSSKEGEETEDDGYFDLNKPYPQLLDSPPASSSSGSGGTASIAAREKVKLPRKASSGWKNLNPINLDGNMKPFDLRYDGNSAELSYVQSKDTGFALHQSQTSSSGSSCTGQSHSGPSLPADHSSFDHDMQQREELVNAIALEEKLERKKRKRQEREMIAKSKQIKTFL